MVRQARLFSGSALFALHWCSIGPKQPCPPSVAPDWLSLSAAPIPKLSRRLQLVPHKEVTSTAAQPHSLFMWKWPQPCQ